MVNGIGRSYDSTGAMAKSSRTFNKLPKDFDKLLGTEAEDFKKHVDELADGNGENLDKVIDKLNSAKGKISDKELMTLVNEINDFIVPTQQNGSTKKRLDMQHKFQQEVVNSDDLSKILDTEFDPLNEDEATGDNLGAFIKDFRTEQVQNEIARNKKSIKRIKKC